jgi:spore maturation protein CgeB
MDVSVVTGTYDRLPYLKAMIQSVRDAIAPEVMTYEIVVVDGGSTDGSLPYLKAQPDVVLIEQGKLMGAIKAFDAGFAVARGQYVVIANDDLTFEPESILKAWLWMQDHPRLGMGLFYTDRAQIHKTALYVAQMPAHLPDGRPISIAYGGIAMIPKWLGDLCGWWALPGAYTYGGDCALCARVIEQGYAIEAIPGAAIHETIPHDKLNAINNPPTNDDHPDTRAYTAAFPHGPEVGRTIKHLAPEMWSRKLRTLSVPIYENKHAAQHAQKRGMTTAFARLGPTWEVDYAQDGPEKILEVAKKFKPDLVFLQAHYAEPFTVQHAQALRRIASSARLVCWNGDVYDRSHDAAYVEVLRYFDLFGCVNITARDKYRALGVKAEYIQIPYEADGVGHKPDATTPKHDVLFMGNCYQSHLKHGEDEWRVAFAKFIRGLPYNTGIYGQWPKEFQANGNTLYDFRAGCKLYKNCTLSLSDSQWMHTAYGYASNRLFQALAAGNHLHLHQKFDGMAECLGLRDGEHLVCWENFDDLRTKIDYWIHPNREAQRLKIAQNGQRLVLKLHSAEHRVRQIIAYFKTPPQTTPGADDPTLAAYHEVRK